MTPKPFEEPRALDLLTEFRKKYIALAEHRCDELRAQARFLDNVSAPELRAIYVELDSIQYFEQELNRVITAFVNEATKPWRDAYTSTLRFDMLPSFGATIIGKPTGTCGACGGLIFGAASHYCPTSSKASGTHAAAGKDQEPA